MPIKGGNMNQNDFQTLTQLLEKRIEIQKEIHQSQQRQLRTLGHLKVVREFSRSIDLF
ncbi:hypothetical protein DSM107010_00610 [Chroococcidiopsis cubana SAG 39.79]|uniref:Uncharacterized protein n=1 Tax=Chroococcidiopsis cubana SAG 39.79 TaxID=388085 RepID=A0AB37USR4_9CYAN|nr:hypothetical protein [Chroococcidiopsis cubana]RUT14515.1 hypothetical protein DSM107010_00610 [Chroococcidiopsis cubana SAG 39.79]